MSDTQPTPNKPRSSREKLERRIEDTRARIAELVEQLEAARNANVDEQANIRRKISKTPRS